jgi:nitroreductase
MAATAALKPIEPWSVSERDFPADAPLAERFAFLLNYAVLAPSSHNTQPWRFALADQGVEIFADRSRGLPVVDPDDRELLISCGAALFHLRLAMRYFGLNDLVDILPSADVDLLARVRVDERHTAAPETQAMFRAILRRRTNRQAFEKREVPDPLLIDLQAAAKREAASLVIVRGDSRRTAIVDLIAAGDRMQLSNKSFRRELAAWVRPNHSEAHDGVPGYGFGFSDVVALTGPFVIRTFDLGNFQAARDRELAEGSPVLAALTTAGDLPANWIAAGQALARVMLLARANQVWASFLNQPIEVENLRMKVREALDTDGYPQLILRMGYAPDVRPTPRRVVSDVLKTS